MNQKKIIGSFAVLVGILLISLGFIGIFNGNLPINNFQQSSSQYVQNHIENEVRVYGMAHESSHTRVINAGNTSISIVSETYFQSAKSTGLAIVIYVNGNVYSASFTLIENVSSSLSYLTLIPIYGGNIHSTEHISVNTSSQAKASVSTANNAIKSDGFSEGWFGFAITLNQQQTIELTALVAAGAAISGFIAAVAGVTVLAGLIAAVVALILTLTVSYITFMDAYGDFQGIYFAETYALVGWIGAPENTVPWGF